MTGALGPRLVLVTRETDYDQLMARHATRGQATAFLRQRAQSLDGLDDQRHRIQDMLTEIRGGVPKGWRMVQVRRAELDRFLFGPEDIIVAVGQDGLVANVAKYLDGQPVIGVNADPVRNAGILVPHAPGEVAHLLPLAAAGRLATEERTMIQAELDTGQVLLALNEVFIGHASHQSARYTIRHGEAEEAQSSSGVIVASGTGATGWALSISRATGVDVAVQPTEAAAVFLVREPWPSRATGVSLASGRLARGDQLLLVSRMNEGGVVFADGMEGDRLDFAWGRTLRITLAERRLRFVPGRGKPASPPPPVRPTAKPARQSRSPAPPPLPTTRSALPQKAATLKTPVRKTPSAAPLSPELRRPELRRRVRRARAIIYGTVLLLVTALLLHFCGAGPPDPPPPPAQQFRPIAPIR